MIKKKFEEYFENTHSSEHMDYTVQMLSLTDKEIENIGEEKLNVIVAKPTDNYKVNLKEEEMEGSSNQEQHRYRKSHQNPFRAGDHKGYHGGSSQKFTQYNIPEEYQPTRRTSQSNINLNLDCVTNREQLIEEWDNEMRLIIKTDENLINDFDLIFTLAKCKTSGNVRLLLEQLNVSLFINGTGEEFLTHLTNSIYTVFVGKNYLTQGLEEKIKKAEEARKRLVSLQICDLCKLESFYCDYEKHLLEIPMGEWSKYVEDFIRKIPFAGKAVLPEYLQSGDVLGGSLAYAKLLITNFMEKHCEEMRIKKAMKSTFSKCCSNFPHPSSMYGCGNPNNNKYRYKYKKIKRKYKLKKPRRWNNSYKYKRPYKRFFRKNPRYQ